MTHEFSIPVHDLDAAGKDAHFRVRAEWIRTATAPAEEAEDAKRPQRKRDESEEIGASKDGSLDVRVSKSGADVVVHGTLEAELEVPCARCLQPAAVKIDQPVSVLMVPAGQMKAELEDDDEERELSQEEADVLPYDGDTVVLDDLVRDELLLAIPMTPLCSEDCPGISPAPGSHAPEPEKPAIDPRLAPLLKFKKESKS